MLRLVSPPSSPSTVISTKTALDEEPITEHFSFADIQFVLKECLRNSTKDGLAGWGNVENCFW